MSRKPTDADILMWVQIQELFPAWTDKEVSFYPKRKWKFDFTVERIEGSYPIRIAVEIEGGAFIQGRHTRGVGFIKDMEKYNHAVLLGWRVLRFTPKQVLDGSAIAFIKQVLAS